MRFIRCLDPQGHPAYATPPGDDGLATLLDGDPYTGLTPTEHRRPVARYLPPIHPANIFCIGLNYHEHARETGAVVGEHPVVFMKPNSAATAHGEPIRLPACQLQGPEVDYECELAVVIGRAGRDIPADRALEHVLGYTAANDVSARRWQKHAGGGQWVRGKSFDTFCPLGPVLVTPDEVPDPQALRLRTTVNGRVLQDSTTADMIFTVAQVIAFLSLDTTLAPGTVILTGTPPGVGVARDPKVFLAPGDEVVVEIEGVTTLRNPVVAAR